MPNALADKAKQQTQLWAETYRDDFGEVDIPEYELKDCSNQFVIKEDNSKTDEFIVEGYANTIEIDSVDDIIIPKAWERYLDEYLRHGSVFGLHAWWEYSIGKCLEAKIDDYGIWVRDKISAWEEEVRVKIRERVLSMMSVGFRIVDSVTGNAKESIKILNSYGVNYKPVMDTLEALASADSDRLFRVITEAKKYEHSIVNVGANPGSYGAPAKSKTISFKSFIKPGAPGIIKNGKDGKMPDKKFADAEQTEKRFDAMTSDITDLKNSVGSVAEARKNIEDINSGFKELQNNAASASDLKAFEKKVEKTLTDSAEVLEQLQKQVEAVPADPIFEASSIGQAKRLGYLDGFEKADTFKSELIYKEHSSAAGHIGVPASEGLLKEMQLKHDDLMMLGALAGMTEADPSNEGKVFWKANPIGKLKVAKDYVNLVKEFQHVCGVEKAMDSATDAEGQDWLPTQMSATLIEDLEVERKLASRIPRFNMPTASWPWPLKGAEAQAYIVSEATDDMSADVITPSTPGTSDITFTAQGMGAGVWTSKVFIEDSIIPVLPFIRQTLQKALINGEENALINGDNSTTHQDTDDAARSAAWITKIFDGLRYDALNSGSATYDVSSTLTYANILAIMEKAGKYAISPGAGFFVVSVAAYFKMLALEQFTGYSNFAMGMVAKQGVLPNAIGHDIVPSAYMRDDLDSNGVNGSSDNVHTGILFVYPRAYGIGDRRVYTVEREDKIWRQQVALVATQRIDFQKLATSTEPTCAFGYNITSAA